MTPPESDQQREDGMAALSLLVTAMVVAMGIALYMVLPLTVASDHKAANRTAADAAALAGAKWVRSDIENQMGTIGWKGSWDDYGPHIGTGLGSAQDYAQRNGGTLIAYNFTTVGWQAHAKVESSPVRDDIRPVSEATATLDFPHCQSQVAEPPTPSPTPEDDNEDDDSKDEAPEPPPPPTLKLQCAGLNITLDPTKIDGQIRYLFPSGTIGPLIELIHPKLIR